MTRIAAFGISVDLPPGWDGRIARRRDADHVGTEHPVVHVASFSLPEQRGDFGSGAVERMRAGDVLLCLIESDPEDLTSPLFARRGVPRFRTRDFAPDRMQRTLTGMCGAQAFFGAADRAFSAYAVLGSHRARASLVPALNDILATLEVQPSSVAR